MKVPINKITGGPMFAQGLTVPQFNQLGPYELNSTPDALPTTSLNGITGTWNPTTIDTSESGTTTYTFTPDGGQSAIPVTMDIQVIVLETSYFIMTVGLPYTVPTLAASGPYDYRVDVVETSEVYVNQTGDCAISGSGTATIKISGLFPHIYVNDQYGNQNIKSVEQWGTNKWQSFERAFYGAYGVSWNFTDAPDLSEVENMSYAFANVNTNLPASINNWDVSNVTNMSYTFGYFSVFNRPLNYWNVLNVTNMTYMFAYNYSFNQDISSWCVSSIPSKPSNFDTNTTAWVKTNRQPAWGTCPGLTFAQLGPYVIDETPDALPTTSLNGIVGTWNPSTIDTTESGTTTYTFTATNPIYGTYDMDIVVNKIVPTFNQLGPYEFGDTPDALPTTSTNGATGSWDPAVIDTNTTGITYTFTPDDMTRYTTTTMSITLTVDMTIEFYDMVLSSWSSTSPHDPAHNPMDGALSCGDPLRFRIKNFNTAITYYYEADVYNVYRGTEGTLKEHVNKQQIDSNYPTEPTVVWSIDGGSGDSDNTVKWYLTFSNNKTSNIVQCSDTAIQPPSILSITAAGTALPTTKAAGTYTIRVNQNSWTKAYGEEYRLFSNDPSGAAWDSGWTQSDHLEIPFTAPVNHYIWGQIRNLSATSSLQGALTIT